MNNLTTVLCDEYLMCPNCHSIGVLKVYSKNITCLSCNTDYKMNYGIPALLSDEDIGVHSSRFLNEYCQNKIEIPYLPQNITLYHRLFGELIYFFALVFFANKYGLKNLFRLDYNNEVERAIYFGWKNYRNLLLKGSEIFQFNKMIKYLQEPSLEIGCGRSNTTNMIFRDRLESVTFGCEYFMDNFLRDPRSNASSENELSPHMFKVIKHYVGGSIKSLPFSSEIFNAIYLVHIVDHIVDLEIWFKEIYRILKKDGYLVFTCLSKNVFNNLPSVKIRRLFSNKWADRYKQKRIERPNPYSGGVPLKSEYEYDATGMNVNSIDEWTYISKQFGFKLIDYSFFGKYWAFFLDIEKRGYYRSLFFNGFLYSIISKMIDEEKIKPLNEKDSTNLILVFKK